jgi:formylglycine-generating enzyme
MSLDRQDDLPPPSVGGAGTCCGPSRGGTGEAATVTPRAGPAPTDGMVTVAGGSFWMGSNDPFAYGQDGEGPPRQVEVDTFWIDACAVTIAQFHAFVDDSGYVTEAERFGWSFVFAGLLPDDFPPTRAVARAPWWRKVDRADWQHPEGPQSSVAERLDHPVVHVSWNDAVAYCKWARGRRLPTEAEWEYAARGGLERAVFPWGDDLEPGGAHRMNVWQGEFPTRNTGDDGYVGLAPANAFEPNGFGLYNMTGNVWEWTADWFHPSFRQRDRRRDPHGPPRGTAKVQKGGSYLCHHSYCRRYRVAARQSGTPDSSTGNVGFRCVRDASDGIGLPRPAVEETPGIGEAQTVDQRSNGRDEP